MGHIRVRNIGKAYKRYPQKWGRLAEWVAGGSHHELKWILRDLTFDVAPGEAVGIIGFNGAGKSTLLKMISGTTRPTTGNIDVGGRISALLELGIGFHPDFTGRQNAYMAGQLRGASTEELDAQMHAIEEFADIGDYIDQPLRVYSSGMAVRLAFSVATAVRPEILIVDEALAVGDVLFQQKCFNRIRAFCNAGTTLLFVSHSMASVYSLCDRALLIHDGHVAVDGKPKQAIDLYNALALRAQDADPASLSITGAANGPHVPAEGETPMWEVAASAHETIEDDNVDGLLRAERSQAGGYSKPGAAITNVRLLHDDKAVEALISESAVTVVVSARFDAAFRDPHIGFQIRDARGEPVFMTHTHGMGIHIGPVRPDDEVEVRFEFHANIAPGDYSVTAGIANDALLDGHFGEPLARIQGARSFTVLRNFDSIHWAGVCNLAPVCSVRRSRP
ncbi:MAG TPA: ABC transporter ATP-binding protein [Casimicrobiaceae bacterium]